MKITAGLGSIDDYPAYTAAGADEVFAGYVPGRWLREAGEQEPLNRREVSFVNVQLGTASELAILRDMVRKIQVPVTLAFNSPFYRPERYPLILDILRECMELGFFSFILADPVLLMKIKRELPEYFPAMKLHLSGEMGEATHFLAEWGRAQGAARLIFPRKTTLREMREVARYDRDRHPDDPLELEAFVLNEQCHYAGSLCMSLHCDAFAPACRLPYVRSGGSGGLPAGEEDSTVTGASGCGLCSLWALREAGVGYAKLVSRGQNTEDTLRDIRALRRAIAILEASDREEEYLLGMKAELFPDGCSGNCYYR